MNLSTRYLGFSLPHPLVPGASPLAGSLDSVRRLEDAGAPLIVLPSLFEEQVTREDLAWHESLDQPRDSFGEALSYFPDSTTTGTASEEYLDHLRRVKAAVDVPVVASLNGVSRGGWLKHAVHVEQAGADALELNLYSVPGDPRRSGSQIERESLELVTQVREAMRIPIAVKLSPFYSSLAHFALELDRAKINGLVLFNRFYQPDIQPESLELESTLHLSESSELLLRLRWIGMLYGRTNADLAVTGGVHTTTDVVKSIMAGASVVQTVSALLRHGPGLLEILRRQLAEWLEEHQYDSLEQMRGSMSLQRCPQPETYERANYARILQTWNTGKYVIGDGSSGDGSDAAH